MFKAMPKARFNYETGSLKICVDKKDGARLSGRVLSCRLKEPIFFSDMSEFLLLMERVMDIQNYPQAFQKRRAFRESTLTIKDLEDDSVPYLDAQTVAEASGETATFKVFVVSRQNSTWQGRIDWLDGSKPEVFRSDLELITLIDARLNK